MNDGVNSIDDTGLGSIYIVNANGQQTLLYTPPPAPTGLLAKMKSLIFGNGNAPVKAPDNCGCCDKLKKLLGQAYLADDVYTDNSTGEENVPNAPNYMRLSNQQLQQLGIDPSMMVDNKIGFYSALYYNRMDQTYSIAYRGTHNLANWKSNVKQGLGFPEPAYLDAAQLGTLLGNLFPGKICGIGHSLGGGENSVSSLSGHFPGVNFNPAGVSPITAARLGIPTGGIYVNFGINPALAKLAGVNLVDADKYITAYSVPGDILSQGVNFMPGVPGTDGQQVLLDSPGTLPLGIDRHLMGNVEAAIQREMAEHGCQ